MNLKKSCGLMLVLWALLVAAYASVAWPRIHEVAPTLIVAVLGGTFASMLLASLWGLVTGKSDRSAFQRAERNLPREDGRIEAASGPIRPLGAPLEGPFTGRPCVAYEYDVKHLDGERSDFAGMALTPCVIDTPTGPVKLLGWAVLDQFGGDPRKIDHERGLAYLRSCTFEPLGLTTVFSMLSNLLADDDGTIRKDFRIENAEIELQEKAVVEKVVPAGDTVTALGVWSAEKGGFLSSRGKAMNRLLPGGLSANAASVGGNPLKQLGVALVFFLALHALLVPMYFLAPGPPKKDSKGKTIDKNPSVWDERDCRRLKDLLAAGANPNEKAGGGRTPLMNAVANRNTDCIRSLVAAGARPNDKDEDGSSAMSWAVTSGDEELIDVLRKAGGTDFRVTAENGRPLEADDEPMKVVRAYDAAIHAGDLEALGRLGEPSTAALIRQADALKVWQDTRPREPELVSGYWTDDAATLAVRGATAIPLVDDTVHYHLEKRFDGWHVKREWFFDKATGR